MKPIIQSAYDSIRIENYNKEDLYRILKSESLRWSQNLHKWFLDRNLGSIYECIFGNIIHKNTSPSISKIMYDFCIGQKYCKICGMESKYFTFTEGYCHTCGNETCYNKLNSKLRCGDKNPCHKMTDFTKKEAARKQSVKIKAKILDGSFTPCITNSWANSRCKIKIEGNCEYLFRSTWEAMFWILTGYEYEKVRIQYKDLGGISHTYIVDFVDYKTHTLYEIKPSKLVDNSINKIKMKYAKSWCRKNGYNIVIIDEHYLKQYKDRILSMTTDPKIIKAIEKL